MYKTMKNAPALSYISVSPFNLDFFTYKFSKTGSLTTVKGATLSNCPAGRVLRENGKKLYPDQTYGNVTYAGPNPGVKTYMVGVYDSTTLLSGFIDPNSPVFVIYNTDKPYYQADGIDPGPGNKPDNSPPVLTDSLVRTLGDVTSETGNLVLRQGRIITSGAISGKVDMSTGTRLGNFKKLSVSATGCKTTSIVYLTYGSQAFTGTLSAEDIADGSFTIVSSNGNDASIVQYIVFN